MKLQTTMEMETTMKLGNKTIEMDRKWKDIGQTEKHRRTEAGKTRMKKHDRMGRTMIEIVNDY